MNNFIVEFSRVQDEVHMNALEHGFWPPERSDAECIALIHSEASEALEAIRKGDIDNLLEELADIVIRVMDFAGNYSLPLSEAILKKHEVNKARPYKHGKKF